VSNPIDLEEAEKRGLLAPAKHGIHTFSNSDDYFGWAGNNCHECWFYDHEGPAGEHCAFEGAALIGIVSPELAEMFGWTRHEKYPDSWVRPRQCPFFKQRPDDDENGDTPPPPPDPDPHQLVLIADPTEDLALAKAIEQNVSSPDELLPV
jgi:hypothetical protein